MVAVVKNFIPISTQKLHLFNTLMILFVWHRECILSDRVWCSLVKRSLEAGEMPFLVCLSGNGFS